MPLVVLAGGVIILFNIPDPMIRAVFLAADVVAAAIVCFVLWLRTRN
jgi:hypothetical protein